MQLKTILNRVERHKSFVYGKATWVEGEPAIEVSVYDANPELAMEKAYQSYVRLRRRLQTMDTDKACASWVSDKIRNSGSQEATPTPKRG